MLKSQNSRPSKFSHGNFGLRNFGHDVIVVRVPGDAAILYITVQFLPRFDFLNLETLNYKRRQTI